MNSRAALILAGGSARRFQIPNQPWQDKALVHIKGTPLLVKSIENIQSIVDEVAICINNAERKMIYRKVLKQHHIENVKFVFDQTDYPVKGPALAIMSGLHAVSSKQCLTLPVDMPFLKPEVADYMFTVSKGFDAVIPMWPDGTLETLVMGLNRKKTIEIIDVICMLNKPKANNIARGTSKLLLVSPMQEIQGFDPKLKSFTNINTQADIDNLPSRSTDGEVKEKRCIYRGEKISSDIHHLEEGAKLLFEGKLTEAQKLLEISRRSFKAQNLHFWTALSAEILANGLKEMNSQLTPQATKVYKQAINSYGAEAKEYSAIGCRRLAECAIADKEWCQSQIAN
jgi:molybdopterin-guanine dinucleotide biosynthesis protein A